MPGKQYWKKKNPIIPTSKPVLKPAYEEFKTNISTLQNIAAQWVSAN